MREKLLDTFQPSHYVEREDGAKEDKKGISSDGSAGGAGAEEFTADTFTAGGG